VTERRAVPVRADEIPRGKPHVATNPTSTGTEKLIGKNNKIRLGLLPRSGDMNKVVCASYYDGSVVFGLKGEEMEHPATRLSFSGQNTVLWIARYPFTVEILAKLPDRLFDRMPSWHSVQGLDGLHRVQTGPLNPEKSSFIDPGTAIKYSIHKRLDAGANTPDPQCESLDPHIIVEP
jgi:hypothetical protein